MGLLTALRYISSQAARVSRPSSGIMRPCSTLQTTVNSVGSLGKVSQISPSEVAMYGSSP